LQAQKQNVDAQTANNPFDGETTFQALEKFYTLKLLPDETVDGKPCHVIEMIPTDPAMRASMGRTVSYHDKKTGVSIKNVSYDGDGKVTSTTLTTNIKIDEKVDPAQFVFKAPPGVTVQDLTKETP